MGAPELGSLPPDGDDADRARRLRRLWALVQAGAAVFLVVVMLGLVPAVLGSRYPALGRGVTVAVLIVAPAVPIALLVVAALRLRR